MTIRLTALADAYGNGVEFDGTVCGAKREGYDFMINIAPSPQVLENMRRVRPRGINGVWNATIELDYDNSDYQLKLDNLRALMMHSLPESQDVTTLPVKDGQHRGLFELRSVICEFRPEIYSPAFRPEFLDSSAAGKVRILQIVDELLGLAGLDPDQSRFIHACIDEGVPGNITILQGRPGSGKSATIGYLIVILMLFDQKVIATGQANATPSTLLDKVRKIIGKHERQIPELSALRRRITRLYSPRREQFNMSNLAANIRYHEVEPDCMAARVREYLRSHPQEQDVIDFERHMAAQDAGQTYNPRGINRGVTDVLARLQEKVCDTMLLVAPTTFASSALAQINYYADVIAIDEAARATEPDALNVLLDQTKVKLVLLVGDVKQLPPVVKSLQARSNPWATILVVPMMKRLLNAYPHISGFELTYNYRSHEQLVRMAANIFYDRKMYCGDHPRGYWSTLLDLAVLSALKNERIFPYDHRRIGDHRQVFYAYEGLPVPEVDGTSLTNPTGVRCVAQKTSMLLEAGVKPEEIGIITFYKEDKRCIREALAALDVDVDVDVETSTVEAFIGREKEVILIHFVVANDDEENPFGFVSNPKRLCMATTRAKRFQFMFGNIKFWREWQRKPSSRNKDRRHKEMFQICDWVEQQRQVVEWNRVTPTRARGQVAVGVGNQHRVDVERNGGGVDDVDDDFQ